jgi:hypothetical protein
MHEALLAQPEQEEEVVEHLPPVAPPQDEEMTEAPPLPVEECTLPQIAPPLPADQTPPAQIVIEEEKMEGVEPTGLSTPLYTPHLPNAGVAQGPHFPTTPHQPMPQLTATPATPAINHVAIPQSTGSAVSPTPEPHLPQTNPPPVTLQTAPAKPNPLEASTASQFTPSAPGESTSPESLASRGAQWYEWRTPIASQEKIHGDPQDPCNIKTSPHTCHQQYDPDFQTYTLQTTMATPFKGVEEAADPNHKIMQAFTMGLVDSF